MATKQSIPDPPPQTGGSFLLDEKTGKWVERLPDAPAPASTPTPAPEPAGDDR